MEVVESLSLEVFKEQLDLALSALHRVTRWGLVTKVVRHHLRHHLQPQCFRDSVTSVILCPSQEHSWQ